MDVGMMMVFASYGWRTSATIRFGDEEIRLARSGGRFRLRRVVVGRCRRRVREGGDLGPRLTVSCASWRRGAG